MASHLLLLGEKAYKFQGKNKQEETSLHGQLFELNLVWFCLAF